MLALAIRSPFHFVWDILLSPIAFLNLLLFSLWFWEFAFFYQAIESFAKYSLTNPVEEIGDRETTEEDESSTGYFLEESKNAIAQ